MDTRTVSLSVVVLLAVCLSSVGCRGREEEVPAVECRIVGEQEEYVVGEPIWITLVCENRTDDEITLEGSVPFPPGSLVSREGVFRTDFFHVGQRGGDGGRYLGPLISGAPLPPLVLAPQEIWLFRFNLTPNRDMTQPGIYTVSYAYHIMWSRSGKFVDGTIPSGRVTITLVEEDE